MQRSLGFLLLGLVATSFGSAPTVRAAGVATSYYVRAGGSDSSDGRSPDAAWSTIARVNRANLLPGDQVLFHGGDSFTGLLYVAPGRGGTTAAPLSFGTYGGGRATISGGSGGAFFAYDAAGIAIDNLNFAGAVATANSKDGVAFYNDLAGDVKLAYISISHADISGFGKAGISIGGWNGASGFTDVQVTSSSTHDNRLHGLISYGPAFNPGAPTYANSGFYLAHVSAYKNLGNPALTTNSGNGIVLGSVAGATIERSSAWGNGSLCTARQCGAGMWTYDSTSITIQHDESYGNRSTSHIDGDGFDLDQNVSDSVLQYNYSHDNGGAGLLDYSGQVNTAHTGNTIRFSVSENDARMNDGAITVGGHVYADAIYNNTVFTSSSTGASPAAVKVLGAPSGITVRNNILEATGGAVSVSAPALSTSAVVFQQNDYPGMFRVLWGAVGYTSLDGWRTAVSQERVGTNPAGLSSDPLLANPGHGGTVGNPDLLANLGAYKLLTGSPLHSAGLNLGATFGFDAGVVDFYGVVLVPSRAGIGAAA